MKQRLHQIHLDTLSRCYKLREKSNPPSTLNSGDVWHDRKVVVTSLASAEGNALLTSGFIMTALSPNAATIPVRIKSIRCWAIAGTAGSYPPTFLQVNFANEEFVQSSSASASIRDSLVDAGGQGSGPPNVGLGVPDSLRLTRADWTLSSAITIATATSLPASARVMWQVSLSFKF